MTKTPSEILRKSKTKEKKNDKGWKKSDKDTDDKPNRRDGFLNFIAKAKAKTVSPKGKN